MAMNEDLNAAPAPADVADHRLRVKTDVFEGPVDLLLTLAQRHQVDLNQVRLADLTWDYLASLQTGRRRPAEEMAAFLLVGAKLLALKAAGLLPGTTTEEEEENLERWEEQVRERMLEYQRFKDAALELMRRHQEGGPSFTSLLEGDVVPVERLAIHLDGLAAAFQAVLDRLPTPEEVAVEISRYSLADEMERVRSRLLRGGVLFGELFQQALSRMHAVVIFLALLELIRLGEAGVRQRSTFGEIEVTPTGA
ncbi:MAG TPA: segregation/condensation protein A [Candidatus Dormibacteraeota bacterium]|nr:segregation/condensation protein A [Candidatus Dormibacteraeota bacterium]